MDTSPNTTPKPSISPVWYGIGAVLFLVVLAVLFFTLASATLRHRLSDEPPPAGSVPSEPGPAVAH